AVSTAFWARSFFHSDWVLRIQDEGRTIDQIGAAASRGNLGVYVAHRRTADRLAPARTIWQHNVVLVAAPSIYPLSDRGLRLFGFGWLLDETPTYWFCQVTLPCWFVTLAFALPGGLIGRRFLWKRR